MKYVVDTSSKGVSNQACRGHLLERPSKHHEGLLGTPWGTSWETLGTPWRALEKAFPIKYVVDTSLRGLPQKAFPIKYVVDTSLRGLRNITKGPWERLGEPPGKPWGRLGGPWKKRFQSSMSWTPPQGFPKCARNEALGPPKSTKIDHLGGSWGHMDHFWSTWGSLGGIGCVLGPSFEPQIAENGDKREAKDSQKPQGEPKSSQIEPKSTQIGRKTHTPTIELRPD